MLTRLTISNFAIIKRLDISFQPGLNILSGETGAGKSIIINAMNLILGGRASGDLIRTGCEEAMVEALFSIPSSGHLTALLQDLAIPFDGDLLIRRSLHREGRNRISINGTIATLQMLSSLGDHLISISGQHEHQRLLRQDHHLSILDEFGGLVPAREAFAGLFNQYQSLREQLQVLERQIAEMKDKQELARFQREEIDGARIEEHEDETLSKEKMRLEHAEQLLTTVSETYQELYENDRSLLSALFDCAKKLEKAARIDDRLGDIARTIAESRVVLEEAAISLREIQGTIEMDPQRLEAVQERLEILTRLKRKYGPSLPDVLAFRQKIATVMDEQHEKTERKRELQSRLSSLGEELLEAAYRLSDRRKQAARRLEKAVEKELHDLNMPNTRFRVAFLPQEEQAPDTREALSMLRSEGIDQVEFLLAPNVGEALKPLAKIASGGELSRIMLALKSILARSASVESVIFDEVDAGIGGATAEVVGEKLVALARFHQILCITHLPQIASKAHTHYQVRKNVVDGRTESSILELGEQERVEEIARLLAGRKVTPQALAHAREMVG
ncbi:MAG: DNA repair protein RecN [Deltaproteobacteria bacterium]|nr:DNA repair protein RecN [Deltaproteobacteria bacterium]